jgi:uroporphyrinogen decarboxylase
MRHRDRIAAIYAGTATDRPGLWLGDPHEQLVPHLYAAAGVTSDEGLRRKLGDDCRWLTPPEFKWYRAPTHERSDGLDISKVFDTHHGLPTKLGHGEPGCFADTTDAAVVDRHPWPDAARLDLTAWAAAHAGLEDTWRMGGSWGCFFHIAMDYFGFENYFIKMSTDPAVVHAVHRHLTDFYLAANARIYREHGDLVDVAFFGNDFGTQERLFMNQRMFRTFVLPYFKELINQAKSFGKLVQLHSCGSICQAIPDLIDAGIDALHPLQAKAKGMDADNLVRQFGKNLVFVGGIDTQDLMWRGTPNQVRDEVQRLRDIFGDRWIVSPSHEKIMPEVPPANVLALAEAVTGGQRTAAAR